MSRLLSVFGALLLVQVARAQLLPGFEIINITEDEHYGEGGHLNNCGQVAYSIRFNFVWSTEEVFVYDNGSIAQLTLDGFNDRLPKINDAGVVVWTRELGDSGSAREIALWSEGKLTLITDDDVKDVGPWINNLGHVVWSRLPGDGCTHAEIFLYDGETITQITDNGFSNQLARINDNGMITATAYDFCVNPLQSEIFAYVNGETIQITNGQYQSGASSINNLGQITWSSNDPVTFVNDVHLWEDGSTVLITDNGNFPNLNNLGEIAFTGPDEGPWNAWLWRDGEIIQVTDEGFAPPSFNDWGEMTSRHLAAPVTNILYMRRIRTGEADFDGHIDLKDAAAFQNCYTRPGDFDGTTGGFDRLCDCRFLDIDHDRDVDKDDYALFAGAMTGPE